MHHFARLTTLATLASAIALAAGCMVGPNFHSPDGPMPAKWVGPTDTMTTAPASQAALVNWWTTFNDPTLISLVDRAVAANLDLKVAEARLRAARASRGIAASPLWPTANLAAGLTRAGAGGGEGGHIATAHSLFQVGLDASWEADIFGGIRRGVESADANVQAAVEGERNVLVTLSAEVALDYITLRGFQQRIVFAQKNLKFQKDSASITRQRLQAGFVSALDVANADAQVATTSAAIPLLESSARQTLYSLSILLAREPGALVEELSPTGLIPPPPPEIPITLPSELLRRRPDIRQAEAQAHAATALIGVATADLFPKFGMAASFGTSGNTFESLTDWVSRSWSFGPSMSWTLFDGGAIRSNIELQNALTQQALIVYRQAVLTALQDVENALIAYEKEHETRKQLEAAVDANQQAYDLSYKLYTEGQTDFLSVLITERSLSDSQDALVQSNQIISTDLVALYKALGGGWELPPEELAASATSPAAGAAPAAGTTPPAPAKPEATPPAKPEAPASPAAKPPAGTVPPPTPVPAPVKSPKVPDMPVIPASTPRPAPPAGGAEIEI
jgi:NodT family efflux transporter outer membrane factor (OMF) lipoprotein